MEPPNDARARSRRRRTGAARRQRFGTLLQDSIADRNDIYPETASAAEGRQGARQHRRHCYGHRKRRAALGQAGIEADHKERLTTENAPTVSAPNTVAFDAFLDLAS